MEEHWEELAASNPKVLYLVLCASEKSVLLMLANVRHYVVASPEDLEVIK